MGGRSAVPGNQKNGGDISGRKSAAPMESAELEPAAGTDVSEDMRKHETEADAAADAEQPADDASAYGISASVYLHPPDRIYAGGTGTDSVP